MWRDAQPGAGDAGTRASTWPKALSIDEPAPDHVLARAPSDKLEDDPPLVSISTPHGGFARSRTQPLPTFKERTRRDKAEEKFKPWEKDALEKLRARLKRSKQVTIDQKPWYVFSPRSRIVGIRDLATLPALLGVFLVVPFELAFVESTLVPVPSNPLFIFNRVLDAIFWTDMLMTFFVAIPLDPDDDDEIDKLMDDDGADNDNNDFLFAQQTVRYEHRLSMIALAYTKGWLAMDALSSIPSAFDIYVRASSRIAGSTCWPA